MSNSDGLASAFLNYGTNKVLNFQGGYFSFAYGDEIALVIDRKYYILNCNRSLWKLVQATIKPETTLAEAKAFWLQQEPNYDQSSWSGDFADLRT